jgi:hypothetical protein
VESRMSKVTCSVLRLVIPKNKCVKKKLEFDHNRTLALPELPQNLEFDHKMFLALPQPPLKA